MLSQSIRSRLCHRCRNHLWTLFEHGFAPVLASSVRRRQNHWSYSPRSRYKRKAIRAFSSNPESFSSNEGSQSPADAHPYDVENAGVVGGPEATAWDAESLRRHLEKIELDIEALEEGKYEHLHETREKLNMLKRKMAMGEVEAPLQDGGIRETDLRDSVEALRESAASTEEVVREARQLHGEYLPDGVLSADESKTYRRLYGDPLEKVAEEVKTLDVEEDRVSQELLDRDGDAIAYTNGEGREHDQGKKRSPPSSGKIRLDQAKSTEQRIIEVAEQIGGIIRPYEQDEVTEEDAEKGHPLTVAGRFSTSPRTIYLPQESFVHPIQNILSAFSNKHITEMCERTFGGPGLPNSPLTPRSGRILPQTSIPLDASQHGMGAMEANAYVSAIWPSTYAAVTSVLVETRKRLGSQWLRDLLIKDGGAAVLDAGGGGVGILAWRDIISAEWSVLHSSDASPPPTPLGKSTVLAGADNLRSRAASLLENTTFLPRLPDYVHVRDSATLSDERPATQRKRFDVIIAPHTLWSLREEWQRKQQVQNLWSLLNPDGGVLVLIEKGVPRGFEVIAGAREMLLSRYIATADSPTYETELNSSDGHGPSSKGKGMIIAPCTNHAPCPMYPVHGVSRGRKDYCSFQQRYIRPPFLQRILGAKGRNHDDVDFSYVAVQKGRDIQDTSTADQPVVQGKAATDSAFEGYEEATAPEATAQINPLTLPRLVFPPLKRPGHVTIDLCTPAGKIDRWTISKSFSKAAYRDARKASWGDLWALGAKTRVPRNLQLGGEKSKRGKNPNERMRSTARNILGQMDDKEPDGEIEPALEKPAAEEDEAILDDDGFDTDAADVLQQIEQETRRRKAAAAAQRPQLHPKRAPSRDSPQESATTPPSRRQRDPPADAEHVQHSASDTAAPDDISTTKSHKDVANDDSKLQSDPSSTLDLTREERATLEDFASESRADEQMSTFVRHLSRHPAKPRTQKAGKNKTQQPEKENWKIKVERKMAKRRAERRGRGRPSR